MMKIFYKCLVAIALGLFVSCTDAKSKAQGNNEQTGNEPIRKENSMKPTELSKKDFLQKVYNYEANPDMWIFKGDKPCVVDFYATWCGPCKALSPVMDALAEEYAGKVDFYKIDVDKEEELAAAFGVQSIPTLLFIPLKGDPQMTRGAMPKPQLKEIISKQLLGE